MNEPSRLQPQQIGKGDTQRPFVGDRYRDNYEDIFRKPRQQQLEVECPTPNQEEEEESK